MDWRARVVRAVEAGMARRAAAAKYEVSISSVVKLMQRWRWRGTVEPDRIGSGKRSTLATHAERVHAVVAAAPDLTIAELRRRLAAEGIDAAGPIELSGGASVNEPPQIVVHDLEQARAALAAAAEIGCAIELRSAPGAAGYAGVGYLKALGDEVGHELLIDCGDDAGLVMAALRTGCRRIVFSGTAELGRRLADMAGQLGATLAVEAQAPEAVMLQPEDDAAAIVRARVSGAK